MILSMTGYGKAVVTYKEKKINVEVKSLNSKALDLSTRIAPIYREKEMEIRQVIAKALIRGKVDFSIWVEKDATVDAAPINGAIVENYYKQLKAISASAGIPEPSDWFATLLSLPDVTTRTQIEELSDEEWQVAQQAIHQALDALLAFRRQEGAALEKKFHEKVDNIEAAAQHRALREEPRAEDQGDHRQGTATDPRGGVRQEPVGAGAYLLYREARHQRGKTATGQPLEILP